MFCHLAVLIQLCGEHLQRRGKGPKVHAKQKGFKNFFSHASIIMKHAEHGTKRFNKNDPSEWWKYILKNFPLIPLWQKKMFKYWANLTSSIICKRGIRSVTFIFSIGLYFDFDVFLSPHLCYYFIGAADENFLFRLNFHPEWQLYQKKGR